MSETVACNLTSLPFCCGVVTIGEFGKGDYGDLTGFGETLTQAWQDLLGILPKGKVVQAWFVNYRDLDDDELEDGLTEGWQNNELRELVQAIPNVMSLGEFVNPNTGNIIDGYLWRVL